MSWTNITSEEHLEQIIEKSKEAPQVIFKHSTRCSISAVAYQRLQRARPPEGVAFYYLDLIAYRPLSNQIAQTFGVPHESPQVLVIKNGACVYDESHLGISMDELAQQAKAA